MATAPPIKFRCSRCNKLLGVSRSKVNSVVTCPQCSTPLVVPDVAETPPVETPATTTTTPPPRKSPSSSQIEPVVVLWDRSPEPDTPPAETGEPSAFPQIQLEPVSLRPDPPARLRTSTRPRDQTWPETIETSRVAPPNPSPVAPPSIAEIVKVEPLTIREDTVESPSLASPSLRDPGARRNDVVLPRTAVVLWSFLVVLAVVMAFGAGLLVGRFVWTSGVPVNSAVVEPSAAKTAG